MSPSLIHASVPLANCSVIWPWFPIGPAGIRTSIIFACGLAVLILRIAHYHVGLRTTGSGVQTLFANVISFSTWETIFWYFVSSFVLFAPAFLWSTPDSANLRYVTYLSGDRARVNERAVFLTYYLVICGLKRSIDHFVGDTDRLDLGLMGREEKENPAEASISLKKVLLRLPAILAETFTEALRALVITGVVYYLFGGRSFAYQFALMWLRPFYNIHRANVLPTSYPLDMWLLGRCTLAGTLLIFLWAAGNLAFSIFMVKEPLKNGLPLTSDSKDPNGSLLNGLKSKKLSVKVRSSQILVSAVANLYQCFATWELSYIATSFEDRRRAIFADIDRKDGPMWSQVYGLCMEAIKDMESRVDNYGKAPAPPPAPPAEEPRQRVSAPINEANILTPEKSKAGAAATAREVVKVITSGPTTSPTPFSGLQRLAKKGCDQTKDHVLTKEQQQAMSPDNVWGQIQQSTLWAMNFEWFRALFQQRFRTDIAGAVMGSPYAEPTLYMNAVNALSQLSVHSLGEDRFGNVHRDVPTIIRTLTVVIQKVEAFKQSFPVHWSDKSGTKEAPELEQVLEAMRAGLSQVVTSFEPFRHDLRLSPADLRLAKEAAIDPEAERKRAEAAQQEAEEARAELEKWKEADQAKREERSKRLRLEPRQESTRQLETPEMEQMRKTANHGIW